MMASETPLEQRIIQLLAHLGIERAHFVACMPRDWQGLIANHSEAVASLTLICPMGINPHALASSALPVLCITGDQGRQAEDARRAIQNVANAKPVVLRDYFSASWGDPAHDRGLEVDQALSEFTNSIGSARAPKTVSLAEQSGDYAEIAYSVKGRGAPLVLLPLALSPSQWDPLIPALSKRFCTIALSGSHLGMVAHLEARAEAGYMRVVEALVSAAGLKRGDSLLEVGCGPGAIVRRIAKRTAGENPVVGVDVNRYLLREAARLAERDRVAQWVEFREGNGERLPFPENSYDVTVSCTVLEECDADRVLAELVRVTKPGGKVGIIVRSTDMPRWVNLKLTPALKGKVEAPGLTGGNVGPGGCADMSLYERMHRAGLLNVINMPQWASQNEGERLDFMHDRIAALLGGEELTQWRRAVELGRADGSFFIAEPFHCAVGTKP